MNTKLVVLVVGLALLLDACLGVAEARTVRVSVFESGRIEVSSGGARLASAASCDDGLLFVFSETAQPDPLSISRRDDQQRTGTVTLDVRIDSVCPGVSGGQASFEYLHQAQNGGLIGTDIEISGLISPVVLALAVGQSSAQTIAYEAAGTSSQDHVFQLAGQQVSFFGGGAFGSVSQPRILAEIRVAGARFINPQDPAVVNRPREAAALEALSQACSSEMASPELRSACNSVSGAEGEAAVQLARAFDPHELAAVPGSATEVATIQTANVSGRLAALRGGSTGLSVDGLSLSYNGMRLDGGWLPVSLVNRLNATDEESTLFGQQWGVFVNGDISIGSRGERGKEVGFDFNSWGLTSGVDYRFGRGHVLGAAVGYSRYEADLDDDGGTLDTETWTVQGYGSYQFSDALYLDLTLGYGRPEFDQERVIDLRGFGDLGRQVVRGSTDGRQINGSLALNYRLVMGGGWAVTPYGQFRYAHTEIDGFAETGGSPFALAFPDQTVVSRVLSGGARVSRAFNLRSSVLVPFADLALEYEAGQSSFSLRPELVASPGLFGPMVEISSPDRSFGRLDLGASWLFQGGAQVFFSYSALLLERDTRRHTFFVGARLAF